MSRRDSIPQLPETPQLGGRGVDPKGNTDVPTMHGWTLRTPVGLIMLDSTTIQAVRVALSGLAMRQRVIADNVANIETPGFLAGRVQFEQALRAAVEEGRSPRSVQPTVARSLEPTRPDGNNVNLDHEVLSNMDTGLRYQLMINMIDGKASGLRKIISGH